MIKTEWAGKRIGGENYSFRRIISPSQHPVSDRSKNHGNIMLSGVPAGVGIGPELTEVGESQSCFLQCFSPGSGLQAFTVIDETSWQGPTNRRVFSSDKDDFPITAYDDIYRWIRIAMADDSLATMGTNLTGFHRIVSQVLSLTDQNGLFL